MARAYYNEFDPHAAEWLRNLIAAGHIAPGIVDQRSITEITPDDLAGFDQCHFFAGIGIWSLSLRRAGWPDDRPIWTGSCPCQPFSAAGKGKGTDDERHLWPIWFDLISHCRPQVILGEQVASAAVIGKVGRTACAVAEGSDAWFDLVSGDLEGASYSCGATGLAAAGFGGAHIRDRLYWMAYTEDSDWWRRERRAEEGTRSDGEWRRGSTGGSAGSRLAHRERDERRQVGADTGGCGSGSGSGTQGLDERPGYSSACIGVVDREHARLEGHAGHVSDRDQSGRDGAQPGGPIAAAGDSSGMADSGRTVVQSRERFGDDAGPSRTVAGEAQQLERRGSGDRDGGPDGASHAPLLGRDAVDWLFCRDGKWRPVEGGTFPLAHEDTARVGRLRAYGNAIDAEVATQFVRAAMSAIQHFVECHNDGDLIG